MKKHLSKLVCVVLSIVMVITAFPIYTMAQNVWEQVAYQNFSTNGTNALNSSSWVAESYSGSSNRPFSLTDSASGMSWRGVEWNVSNTMTSNSNGTFVNDGYIYLSDYTGTPATPVTGADGFKIDVEFSTTNNIGDSTKFPLLMLGSTVTRGKETTKMNTSNYVFAQDWDGPIYVNGSSVRSTNTDGYNLTCANSRVKAGAVYHYVVSYNRGYLRVHLADADGNPVENLYGGKVTIDTNNIKSLILGDDDGGDYVKNTTYKSITFYTNKENKTEDASKDSSRGKYLFAYFTGQDNSDGEKIRLAVSDDGLNWEALNGNNAILDNTPSAFYPSNGASTGKAASGAARDPFIIQKRNPDGSIAPGYYVLATDLKVNGSDYTNSKLLVWSIDNFTDLDTVKPWCLETTGWFGLSSGADFYAWAPEAIWDSAKNMFMMYWSTPGDNGSGATNGYDNICLHYAYTSDFKTFYDSKGREFGKGGKAEKLINPHFGTGTGDNKNIDGNITYDGELYYLYFKREAEQQIYYATSEFANGPYSHFTKFSDSSVKSNCEGCEVYQLNDGTYILMMDYYKDNGTFLTYPGASLDSFSTTTTGSNINHLSPRHGAVTYITDQEYKDLTAKYGKSTYDATGLTDGTAVNDTLVARYFTGNDVTADATGHGYTLTNAGTGASSAVNNGYTAAAFTSNGATSGNNQDSGSYMYINLNKMYSDYNLNAKDGVTFDWYGSATSANAGRFFDVSNANIGELTWDTRYNKPYAYYSSTREFGVSASISQAYNVSSNSDWHHYTVSIVNGYMNVFVDGILQRNVYSANSLSKAGSPIAGSLNGEGKGHLINSKWFTDVFGSGYLRFGTSVFSGDNLLDGYISDFRIYNRALSYDDITASINGLKDSDGGKEVTDSVTPDFYDPMEDKDTNGDGTNDKTKYDATKTDSTYGEVLAVNGGVATHNPTGGYTGRGSNDGYTITTYFNTGDALTGSTIFCIGRKNSDDGSNRQYLELIDDGRLYYNWEVSGTPSYINVTDAFGDTTLNTNTWYHITIQVVPNGTYDYFYIFLNGSLVKKIDTFNNSYERNHVSGRSVHEYMTNSHNVFYGTGCGYWNDATDGYADEFKIYNGYYNAKDLFIQDSNAIADKLIAVAKKAYTDAMAAITDKPLTNMSAAYDIYDKICRYEDAVAHGRDENGNPITPNPAYIVQLYNELLTAIENMKPYDGPSTINGLTSENNGGLGAVDAAYASNLLSIPDLKTSIKHDPSSGTADSESPESIKYDGSPAVQTRVAMGGFVWLYSGNQDALKAPTTHGWFTKGKSGCDVYARAMYISNGDVSLNNNWSYIGKGGGDTTEMWSNPTSANGTGYATDHTSDYRIARSTMGVIRDHNTWYNFSNVLTFTGGSKMTDSTYLYSFTPATTGQMYAKWTGGSGTYTVPSRTLSDIYVVNYLPVKNALNNADRLDILKKITEYTPSSMKALTDAFDALTSLDYIGMINNVPGNADKLANTMKNGVTQLEGVDITAIEKKADYTEILNTVADNKDFYESSVQPDGTGVNEDGKKYTTSSWTAYSNAYNKVTEHFTQMNPNTDDYGAKNSPYVSDQETLDRLNSNINAAKAVLVEAADYSESENAVSSSSQNTATLTIGNGSSYADQNYTLKSWQTFTDAYDAAKAWADKSTDYKNDTEKYSVTFVNNDYGPYIAFDKDGNIVDAAADESLIDHYTYWGDFFTNKGDTIPSEFEDGFWVNVNGKYYNVEGRRYYASAVDTNTISVRQNAIISDGQNVAVQRDNLADCADYDAYDSATNLLKYYDVGAFNDSYLASADSVYKTVQHQGLSSAVVAYHNGVGSASKQTVTTPAYADVASEDCTAYVNSDGAIWYNTAATQQNELDAVTTNVLSALEDSSTANRRKCTVTYNVYNDDESTVYSTETSTHVYGDTVKFTVPDGLHNYKWIVTYSDGTKQTIPAADAYNLYIQQDGTTTVSAYCSSEQAADQVKVRILNLYGNTVQEFNLNKTDTLDLQQNKYIINGTEYAVNDMPYYRHSGWLVNDASANYGVVSFTDDVNLVVLQPKFDKAGDTYTVSIDGKSVLSNDSQPQPLYYDTFATAKCPQSCYAIALRNTDGTYSIVKYNSRTDNSYSFLAVGDMALYSVARDTTTGQYTINGETVTDAEMIRKLDAKLPYATSVLHTKDKYTIYTQYTQYASGINQTTGVCGVVTEKGTLYTTDPTVGTDPEKFVMGGENVRFVANKDATSTSQYYLRFSKVPADSKVYTRAYIKYSYNPNVADTDTNFNQNTVVQSIDYGNICNN